MSERAVFTTDKLQADISGKYAEYAEFEYSGP
jgi:hypothetical protein